MLILNRKPGEAIVIDGEIRVVVLQQEGGGIRIGVDAPRHISIVREEVRDRIAEENRRAGASARAARERLG